MRVTNNTPIICANGFSMSVQASERHYCDPRIDYAPYYKEVEVGAITFPEDEKKPSPTGWTWATPFNPDWIVSSKVPVRSTRIQLHTLNDLPSWKKLMSYGEFFNTKDPRLTVFSYVPIGIVLELIEEMGGKTSGQLPPHKQAWKSPSMTKGGLLAQLLTTKEDK